MASKTETANFSLGHLGIGKEIQNLNNENSEEANALRRYHDISLRLTQRDFPWGFTKKYANLALVQTFTSTDPEKEWGLSYQYPSDCLKIRKIFSGIRRDSHQSRVRFEIAHSSSGRLIMTDLTQAILVYSTRVIDYNLFPDDFIMAHSFRWALYVPNRLLAGDPFKLKKDIFSQYKLELANAQRNDLTEQEFDEAVESEFIRERG